MDPQIFICTGCAGVGKSTFVSTYRKYLIDHQKSVYTVNLDPAVRYLAYVPDLDIRDNIDYTGIMKSYELGPNGAIATCLNMFVAKIDEIVGLFQTKKDHVILIDTPGQIEIFTWSAAGHILLNAILNCFTKVKLLYIIDAHQVTSSNKARALNTLHACSVLHKYSERSLIVFNRMDTLNEQQKASLKRSDLRLSDSYCTDVLTSLYEGLLPLVQQIPYVGVSCKTGDGLVSV